MRLYAAFVYLFLYIPIAVIAIFSFNSGRNASDFVGFSVKWYGKDLTLRPPRFFRQNSKAKEIPALE